MSAKLHRLKHAIKTGLVDAGIWEEGAILIDRQGDLWNDVATAMSAATHGSVLIIGVAAGEATEEGELMTDLTIPLTILSQAVITPDQQPEEQLWEDTVKALHDSVPVYEGCIEAWAYRLRYQGFTDAPELVEGNLEIAQLARQTTFKVRMPL